MILTAAMNPEEFSDVPDLIDEIRGGDPEAMAVMISRYQHRLYRYLLRMTRDAALADDLFQQTWLRVIQKIGRFDARRNFEAWLFSVAHNLTVDHFRVKRPEILDAPKESGSTVGDQLADRGTDALTRLLESERAALLAGCMEEIAVIHREVLTLRFEEGMKLDQIAEVVGVPLATVKSRLHRALEGLRKSVEARGL